jgi:hypothetical protein
MLHTYLLVNAGRDLGHTWPQEARWRWLVLYALTNKDHPRPGQRMSGRPQGANRGPSRLRVLGPFTPGRYLGPSGQGKRRGGHGKPAEQDTPMAE